MTTTPQEPTTPPPDPDSLEATLEDQIGRVDEPLIPIGPPSDPEAKELLKDPVRAADKEKFVPETFG